MAEVDEIRRVPPLPQAASSTRPFGIARSNSRMGGSSARIKEFSTWSDPKGTSTGPCISTENPVVRGPIVLMVNLFVGPRVPAAVTRVENRRAKVLVVLVSPREDDGLSALAWEAATR